MTKRLLALFLAMLLPLGAMATASGEKAPLFAETLEISILAQTWSPYSTETTLIPEIEKATNTKITVEWAPRQDFDTRVNALLATGDLPDVIIGADTVKLLDQGAIVPLTQYYTEDYAPDMLKILNDTDYVRLRNVNDGEIYNFAYTFDFPPIFSFLVRQDWLDKLNMEVPTDWDGWLAYWRAVRDQDMNGDGDPTNEIPIAGSADQMMMSFGIVVDGLNATKNYFCYMPDGSYGLIQEHPNYQAYLTAMNQLYSEGLLDREFATRDMAGWYKVMDSNLGGSCWAAAEQSKLTSQVLRQSDPNATAVCCPPPKGPLGDQCVPARNKVSPMGVVTVAAEDKAGDIMRFFNWLYSDEGSYLMNYGVEGVHHEVVDGKPKLVSPYVDSFVNARGAGLIFQPFPFLWLQDNYMQILLTGKTYDELDDLTKNFYDGLFMQEPYFTPVAPTLVTDAFTQYSADIFPALREMAANMIAGRITLDDYNKQYEQLKGQGLQAIIDDAAAAWEIVGK